MAGFLSLVAFGFMLESLRYPRDCMGADVLGYRREDCCGFFKGKLGNRIDISWTT